MSFMSQLFFFYNFLVSRLKWRKGTQISQVIGWMMKGILIWKQCREEIVDKKNCDNLEEKKYVFALCLNGIYVRMTLTGITVCVLKTTGILSNFCLFPTLYRHTYDAGYFILAEFTRGCKILKWWFIANHWQTIISLWDVIGG